VERRGKDRPWSASKAPAKQVSAAPAPAKKAVGGDSAEWSEF
jgi:hypothetical protein